MTKREPSTLGAIAVPSGLALLDSLMTLGAVAGPGGIVAAGGAAGAAGIATAAAKKRRQKQVASKTMSGSAKRAVSSGKSPKVSGGKHRAGSNKGSPKSAGMKNGAMKAGRRSSLGKLAAASKKSGSGKRAPTTKLSKPFGKSGVGKRGSMFGAGVSGGGIPKTGRKSSAGKAGFGTATRKLARAVKSPGHGKVRLASRVGRAKKATNGIRKGVKRAGKSRLFGKGLMAVVSAGKFWGDRKVAPKKREDAVDKRMRGMAAKPAVPFTEPVQISLPTEPSTVPLPSCIQPTVRETRRKGTPVSHQFVDALEAVEAAFQSFDPENARAVEGYFSGIAELSAALSRGLNIGGMRISEDFPIDPGAGEYVSGLGAHMGSLQEHIEEANAAFKNAHADQLERINSGDARQVKWDYAANQE